MRENVRGRRRKRHQGEQNGFGERGHGNDFVLRARITKAGRSGRLLPSCDLPVHSSANMAHAFLSSSRVQLKPSLPLQWHSASRASTRVPDHKT